MLNIGLYKPIDVEYSLLCITILYSKVSQQCPPAPERSICASCGEKARAAERARADRLRAEGKLVRDPEARRRADRDRRQHAERKAARLCVKCGRAPIRVLNPRVRDRDKLPEIVDHIGKVELERPIKVSCARGPDREGDLVYG